MPTHIQNRVRDLPLGAGREAEAIFSTCGVWVCDPLGGGGAGGFQERAEADKQRVAALVAAGDFEEPKGGRRSKKSKIPSATPAYAVLITLSPSPSLRPRHLFVWVRLKPPGVSAARGQQPQVALAGFSSLGFSGSASMWQQGRDTRHQANSRQQALPWQSPSSRD